MIGDSNSQFSWNLYPVIIIHNPTSPVCSPSSQPSGSWCLYLDSKVDGLSVAVILLKSFRTHTHTLCQTTMMRWLYWALSCSSSFISLEPREKNNNTVFLDFNSIYSIYILISSKSLNKSYGIGDKVKYHSTFDQIHRLLPSQNIFTKDFWSIITSNVDIMSIRTSRTVQFFFQKMKSL